MSGHRTDLDVLLVEDNPGDAKLVEHHLSDPAIQNFVDDVSLTHVETLEDAGSLIDEGIFDVVLLDLGLERSSGLETLDRAREITAEEPIIVLTGLDDRETAMAAIERGAQDYLPKGDLDGDRLIRALRYAVVRRSQERALERQQEQMEFFNSVLRHDMLNGMTVISSRSQLLVDELEGTHADHAETIAKWSDDIVDLTRTIRSVLNTLTDNTERDLEAVRMGPVLEDVAQRIETMAPGTMARISNPDDSTVHADGLLGDVLANIGTNAVEHSEGTTAVEITVTETRGMVTIRIADDGAGIPDDRKATVFDRGEKGDRSSGTGFGLYFVDSMVEAYGGSVWVEDSESGGAEFVVELPSA